MLYDLSGGGIIHLALSSILPFTSALILIPLLVQIDVKKHLSARPNSRSSHLQTVSSIGGVGIFIAVVTGMIPVLNTTYDNEMVMLVAGFTLLFFTGIKDDIFDSHPYFKLVAQLMASLTIVMGANLKIENLHGFLGLYDIPGPFSILLSVLFISTVINAINFMDGIDGLAAILGIIGTSVAGCIFYFAPEPLFFGLAVSMISALLGFLRYNLSKEQKVFMGDTGSLFIGMALSVFTLKIWQLHGLDHILPYQRLWVLSIVLLPVFDLLRVFLIRVTNGRSPFRADRNHVHHVLVDHCGFKHITAAFFLGFTVILFMVVSFLIAQSSYVLLLLLWYLSSFLFYMAILHQIQKIALYKASYSQYEAKTTHKALLRMVSLKNIKKSGQENFAETE